MKNKEGIAQLRFEIMFLIMAIILTILSYPVTEVCDEGDEAVDTSTVYVEGENQ